MGENLVDSAKRSRRVQAYLADLDGRYTRWWYADNKHGYIWPLVERIEDDQSLSRDNHARYLSLYLNMEYGDLNSGQGGQKHFAIPGTDQAISLNVTQSCVDTLASKICTFSPRPQVLTSGAKWSLRARAKKLDKYLEGAFQEAGVYDLTRDVFLDASLFGTGFLHVFEDDGRICAERVLPSELIVDERCAVAGKPRSMFRVKDVSADVLMHQYGNTDENMEAIAMAGQNGHTTYTDDSVVATDIVRVIEAWHLPSAQGATDGRRVVCLQHHTLADEPYEDDDFPIVPLRWTRRPVGYYGQGLVEQLEPIQCEINKLARRIQDAMELYSVAKTYYVEGSIREEHFRNVSGDMIPVRSMQDMPRTEMPPSVSSEVFSHMWRLYQTAYELSGVSQLSATSRKPSGDLSGVALRTLRDVETERFGLLVKDWENFHIAVAHKFVHLASRLYEHKRDYAVKHRARDFITSIKWSEVNLNRDQYVLKVYPTNLLPRTPAGRIATVQELLGAGMLTPEKALGLLDFPDLESQISLETVVQEDVDRTIEVLLYDGRYVEPDEHQALELGINRARSAYLRARLEDAPEERLELISRWIVEAQELMQMRVEMAAPPVEMAAPPPSAPAPVAMGGAGVPPGMAA